MMASSMGTCASSSCNASSAMISERFRQTNVVTEGGGGVAGMGGGGAVIGVLRGPAVTVRGLLIGCGDVLSAANVGTTVDDDVNGGIVVEGDEGEDEDEHGAEDDEEEDADAGGDA